jgi:hypothetical protein
MSAFEDTKRALQNAVQAAEAAWGFASQLQEAAETAQRAFRVVQPELSSRLNFTVAMQQLTEMAQLGEKAGRLGQNCWCAVQDAEQSFT